MSYKPKYCCECGDRIERASWNFTTSRRFCDVCETNFRHLDWSPRVAVVVSLILTVFAVGSLLRKPEKSLAVLSNDSPSVSGNLNQNPSAQFAATQKNGAAANNQTAEANTSIQPKPANAALIKSTEKTKSSANQSGAAEEAVYFCGAQTKKGTPCTRRVKGGGRCWQHTGQPAMLPPEKLIAN